MAEVSKFTHFAPNVEDLHWLYPPLLYHFCQSIDKKNQEKSHGSDEPILIMCKFVGKDIIVDMFMSLA